MSVLHDVVLPIELTNNNTGRGHAWYSSAKQRDEYEALLRVTELPRDPFPVPVAVTVTRILGKGQRLWDYSSGLRGNWKEIEDALVAVGWFHDDGPQWIVGVDFRQDATQRKNGPAVRVTVRLPGD